MRSAEGASVDFLRSVGRYLSTRRLYDPDHPAAEEAADESHSSLRRLLDEAGTTAFSFLPGEVVAGGRPLDELEDWSWSGRFADSGIRRLEVAPTPGLDEWEAVLDALSERLLADGTEEDPPPRRWPHVQFGPLAVAEAEAEWTEEDRETEGTPDLATEREMADWLFETARSRRELPVVEVLTLVESVGGAIAALGSTSGPGTVLPAVGSEPSLHALRVALLSIRLAEAAGEPPDRALRIGTSGFLHDIGKQLVGDGGSREEPVEGNGDPEGRTDHHTVVGSRFLLESGAEMGLAAVVALEHHRYWDGSGTPALHYEGAPCRATRIVQVADRYDTHHVALGDDEAAASLRDESGSRLEPELVDLLLEDVLPSTSEGG